MSKPWILSDFENAVSQLDTALAVPAESDLVKAGCIQYFEFCFEPAWKAVKFIADDMGLEECTSPKACIRTAFLLITACRTLPVGGTLTAMPMPVRVP